MKKIICFIILTVASIGIAIGQANASSAWITFTSSNVCISTGSNLELLSVSWSSGSSTFGDTYWVAIDSNPLRVKLTGTEGTDSVGSMDYTLASFPATQQIQPAVIMFSTTTAYGAHTPFYNQLRYVNPDGSGRQIKNGLVRIGKDRLGRNNVLAKPI